MQSLIATSLPQRTSLKPEKVAQLAMRKDGTIGALSSDGYTVYTVRLDPLECTCPGFQHHGHCYHSTQAKERFGKRHEMSEGHRQMLSLLYPVN